jgi:hypothetical protein
MRSVLAASMTVGEAASRSVSASSWSAADAPAAERGEAPLPLPSRGTEADVDAGTAAPAAAPAVADDAGAGEAAAAPWLVGDVAADDAADSAVVTGAVSGRDAGALMETGAPLGGAEQSSAEGDWRLLIKAKKLRPRGGNLPWIRAETRYSGRGKNGNVTRRGIGEGTDVELSRPKRGKEKRRECIRWYEVR